MEAGRSEVPIGSSLVTNKSSTTRTTVASALLLVLVVSILAADAAFVHSDNNSRQRSSISSNHHHRNLAFVPTSKIRDLSVTPSVAIASPSPAFRTMLFCDGDDDGDDDMMDMDDDDDDYNDDDYDDDDLVIDVEGDEDYDDVDDDVPEDDPYMELAPSEFGNESSSSALTTTTTNNAGRKSSSSLTTDLDWGGALGALRSRMEDVESGKAGDPSQALFRMMSAPSPNQIIGQFVNSADPQVVQAMSGAVSSLLGGLSNHNMGVEVQVKASGEKIGSLCFQLQMTGA
jgi:hypothetical protein